MHYELLCNPLQSEMKWCGRLMTCFRQLIKHQTSWWSYEMRSNLLFGGKKQARLMWCRVRTRAFLLLMRLLSAANIILVNSPSSRNWWALSAANRPLQNRVSYRNLSFFKIWNQDSNESNFWLSTNNEDLLIDSKKFENKFLDSKPIT